MSVNKSSKRFRLAVLTQEDGLVIPQNIKRLGLIGGVELVAVVRIDAPGALNNKKKLFVDGFGVCQVAKMGALVVWNSLLNFLDQLLFYRLGFTRSLRAVSRHFDAQFRSTNNPNGAAFLDWLESLDLDLIVSFSAPTVFKQRLLETPRSGCINLHCSLLPKFAGLLPSFWALYHGNSPLGATVHRMDTRIDNGAILGQVEVPAPPSKSMFSVIQATKSAGGRLMVSVVRQFMSHSVIESENLFNEDDYYTWPSVEQIRDFRMNGGRLI